jgi:AcrR family transcriptional regulator
MESSNPSPRPTRNAERTRSALLSAAARAIVEKGTGVSLAHIANEAGVSKGGLLHHFATREALLIALVEDANRQFRVAVQGHLDLSENLPGKMLRAYVRALCSSSEEATIQYLTSAPMWAGVSEHPAIAEIMREDERWWMEQFALDGLSSDRILVVRRAAEGMAVALAYGGGESPADITEVRDLLISITQGKGFRG